MAHQQEFFLPFSSQQSLSCCLSRMAKMSTPKTHGPLYSPSELCGPLPFPQNCMVLSFPYSLHQNHMDLYLSTCFRNLWFSPFTSEPRGPLPFPQNPMALLSFPLRTTWSSSFYFRSSWPSLFPSKPHGPLSLWLPRLGLNPSAHLPLQPHFQLLLQSVTPASIPVFFQLYWAAIVSLGSCGSMAWS